MVATGEVLRDRATGPERRRGHERIERWTVTGWALLVVVALVWGALWVAGSDAQIRAAPLYGRWSWHPGPGLLPAAAMAAATVLWGPALAVRAPWRLVPPAAGAWASLWALALAASDGWSQVTAPLTTRHEYQPLATRIDDLGGFLAGYVDRLGQYPIHVQGHPPGGVVVAWVLERVGLGGAGWLAALILLAWGSAVALALASAGALAGEARARRAAPVLAVLPAAVWAGTSFDALYAGILAMGASLAVFAAIRGSRPLAAGTGVACGIGLLCSYGAGLALVVVAAVVVVVAARPVPLLAWAGGGTAAPLALAAAAGFWWPAGLAATRDAYWSGVASDRPALYLTLVGNPAALALAAGPAVAVGLVVVLARARDRTLAKWSVLPLAALAAVVVADLSQMSRGEVERIWLPFVPWLALAAPGDQRSWLVGQVVVTLALQSLLASPW